MLTRSQVVDRAETIVSDLDSFRAQHGQSEALTLVWEKYVEAETDPDMRRLGELIADSRRQAMIQHQLDDDREAMHSGRLNREQFQEMQHRFDTLRRNACVYNHMTRVFIDEYAEVVSEHEIVDWMIGASFGARQWALAVVRGAVSEIALRRALLNMPELSGVRHSTVEEDLVGIDFIAQCQGQVLTIDAKSGLYRPLSLHKRGHRHLEISVPRDAIEKLRLSDEGEKLLHEEIRQALGESGEKARPSRHLEERHKDFHEEQWHYRK
jgi:hypothetical protein